MRRSLVVVVLAVLVVAAVGSLAAGATHHVRIAPGEDGPGDSAVEQPGEAVATGTPTPSVAPGAQFVGAIGAHRERHAGEIDEETVEVRLDRAGSDQARADVVADVYDAKRDRFGELVERGRELRRARDNGTMSESEYLARRAALDVQFRSIERVAVRLEIATEALSLVALPEVDVDLGLIRDLRSDAREQQSGALERIAPGLAGEGAVPTDAGTADNASTGVSDG